MKEYKIDKKHFMSGWFIDKNVCDEIRESYLKMPNMFKTAGSFNFGQIDSKIKQSLDFFISPNHLTSPLYEYRKELQKCLNLYTKRYPETISLSKFNITGNYNLQHYPVNGGFKEWHYERTGLNNSTRVLVFMTYLNDVKDGGTFFKYQNLKIPAKKGLTLIWPSEWTHTHKGEVSSTKEKIIITGWYNFIE